MEKDVIITIESTQIVDDNKDTTKLFTKGKMENIKNGFRICYEESEATGYKGSTVTLDVKKDYVSMLRTGTALSSLILERGKKHHCHYGTDCGDFVVGVAANRVENDLSDDGGDILLEYTLDINSTYMSDNTLSINIKEA